jgi:hypothetical protein
MLFSEKSYWSYKSYRTYRTYITQTKSAFAYYKANALVNCAPKMKAGRKTALIYFFSAL